MTTVIRYCTCYFTERIIHVTYTLLQYYVYSLLKTENSLWYNFIILKLNASGLQHDEKIKSGHFDLLCAAGNFFITSSGSTKMSLWIVICHETKQFIQFCSVELLTQNLTYVRVENERSHLRLSLKMWHQFLKSYVKKGKCAWQTLSLLTYKEIPLHCLALCLLFFKKFNKNYLKSRIKFLQWYFYKSGIL